MKTKTTLMIVALLAISFSPAFAQTKAAPKPLSDKQTSALIVRKHSKVHTASLALVDAMEELAQVLPAPKAPTEPPAPIPPAPPAGPVIPFPNPTVPPDRAGEMGVMMVAPVVDNVISVTWYGQVPMTGELIRVNDGGPGATTVGRIENNMTGTFSYKAPGPGMYYLTCFNATSPGQEVVNPQGLRFMIGGTATGFITIP